MAILKGAKDSIRLKVVAVFEETADSKELKVPFGATYRALKTSEAKSVLESVQAGEMGDEDLMKRYLIAWDLTDESNEPVPLSELSEVMEIRSYRKALVDGFLQTIVGKKALATKN